MQPNSARYLSLQSIDAPVGARINTICFFSKSGEPLLRRIAEHNSGRYRFVGQ
ncbi:MAG: hypothetical protein WBC53_01250 [Phycisphaerae bacterium]